MHLPVLCTLLIDATVSAAVAAAAAGVATVATQLCVVHFSICD